MNDQSIQFETNINDQSIQFDKRTGWVFQVRMGKLLLFESPYKQTAEKYQSNLKNQLSPELAKQVVVSVDKKRTIYKVTFLGKQLFETINQMFAQSIYGAIRNSLMEKHNE